MTLKAVVLPAPFGPIRPTNSPSATESEKSLSAQSPPKESWTPVRSRSMAPSQFWILQETEFAVPHQPRRPPQHNHDQQERIDNKSPLVKADQTQQFRQDGQCAGCYDRAGEARGAPGIEEDQIFDRLQETEAVGMKEPDNEREIAPGDAREEAAQHERKHLGPRAVDAHDLRRQLIAAYAQPGAPG